MVGRRTEPAVAGGETTQQDRREIALTVPLNSVTKENPRAPSARRITKARMMVAVDLGLAGSRGSGRFNYAAQDV